MLTESGNGVFLSRQTSEIRYANDYLEIGHQAEKVELICDFIIFTSFHQQTNG